MELRNVFDFNKALYDGPCAWPGGYPRYFLMTDGAAVSFEAAASEDIAPLIRNAIIGKSDDGWRAVAVCINWEDGDMVCAHTGLPIECAYPADDAAYEDQQDI